MCFIHAASERRGSETAWRPTQSNLPTVTEQEACLAPPTCLPCSYCCLLCGLRLETVGTATKASVSKRGKPQMLLSFFLSTNPKGAPIKAEGETAHSVCSQAVR